MQARASINLLIESPRLKTVGILEGRKTFTLLKKEFRLGSNPSRIRIMAKFQIDTAKGTRGSILIVKGK